MPGVVEHHEALQLGESHAGNESHALTAVAAAVVVARVSSHGLEDGLAAEDGVALAVHGVVLEACGEIPSQAAALGAGEDSLGMHGDVVEVAGEGLLGVPRGEVECEQLPGAQQAVAELAVDVGVEAVEVLDRGCPEVGRHAGVGPLPQIDLCLHPLVPDPVGVGAGSPIGLGFPARGRSRGGSQRANRIDRHLRSQHAVVDRGIAGAADEGNAFVSRERGCLGRVGRVAGDEPHRIGGRVVALPHSGPVALSSLDQGVVGILVQKVSPGGHPLVRAKVFLQLAEGNPHGDLRVGLGQLLLLGRLGDPRLHPDQGHQGQNHKGQKAQQGQRQRQGKPSVTSLLTGRISFQSMMKFGC